MSTQDPSRFYYDDEPVQAKLFAEQKKMSHGNTPADILERWYKQGINNHSEEDKELFELIVFQQNKQ